MKPFSLIYQGDVHLADGEKLIPASDFSELMSASEIVEKAQEDATRLRQELEEEGKAIRQKAQEEGFAEGLSQFNTHLKTFEYQMRAAQIEWQRQMLPLALKAAKKIVGKELEMHPDTIVDIVIQTLLPVVHNHRFNIYVSKADKEVLETARPRLRAILDQVQSLVIQERADITPGGCIIETESGIINATLENQWRALEAAFEKYTENDLRSRSAPQPHDSDEYNG